MRYLLSLLIFIKFRIYLEDTSERKQLLFVTRCSSYNSCKLYLGSQHVMEGVQIDCMQSVACQFFSHIRSPQYQEVIEYILN